MKTDQIVQGKAGKIDKNGLTLAQKISRGRWGKTTPKVGTRVSGLSPDRALNPHFLEKRVSGSKTPIAPRAGKGSFLSVKKKNPFLFCKGTQRKRGLFLTESSLFQLVWERREMGVFGPRNPLFQKMAVRGPVWGRGIASQKTMSTHVPAFCWDFLETSFVYVLVLFKSQLGEPFLGTLIIFSFIFLFFSSFFSVLFIFLLFFWKPALKRAKPALKQPNRRWKRRKIKKMKTGTFGPKPALKQRF